MIVMRFAGGKTCWVYCSTMTTKVMAINIVTLTSMGTVVPGHGHEQRIYPAVMRPSTTTSSIPEHGPGEHHGEPHSHIHSIPAHQHSHWSTPMRLATVQVQAIRSNTGSRSRTVAFSVLAVFL
jgi:hypothetical protein